MLYPWDKTPIPRECWVSRLWLPRPGTWPPSPQGQSHSGLHLQNPQAPEVTQRRGSLRDNSMQACVRLTAGVTHSSPDAGHAEATQPRDPHSANAKASSSTF